MNSSLRPFSDSDYEQLLQIESKIQIAPWNQFQFEGELSKPYSRMWVLTDDETDSEIMGYVVFWDMKDSFEILNLGVAPSHQRQGLARKIVRSVINEALRAEATRLILDVRKKYNRIHHSIIIRLISGTTSCVRRSPTRIFTAMI